MRIYDQNLRNIAHGLPLSVVIAFKGTNIYILFHFHVLCASSSFVQEASCFLYRSRQTSFGVCELAVIWY